MGVDDFTLFVPRRLAGVDGYGLGGTGTGFLPQQFPPMWSDGERYGRDSGYLKSYEALYRSQPVLAGVVDHIARRLGTLPFGAFEEQPNGSRDPIARTHGLATLLRRPRPKWTTSQLITFVMTSMLVHGNAVVAKLRTDRDGPPVMLWPLNWSQLNAYGEDGQITAYSTYQFGADERFILAEDVIHFAWPAPDGSEIGVSPLEKLGITLRSEDSAQRYGDANFRNGSRPSLAVMLPEGVSGPAQDQALQLASAQIDNLHKGVDRSGKTIVLSGGMKIEALSLSPVEVALVEQRRLNREEIVIVYDMAGPSFNDTSNASMGNVVERLRSFYRDVIPPWATLIVETMEAQLVDPELEWQGLLTRFDFKDKLRGEPMEQAQTLKMYVEAGLMTRNEARIELGYPPEGDVNDPENPANALTANTNNQDTLASLEAGEGDGGDSRVQG